MVIRCKQHKTAEKTEQNQRVVAERKVVLECGFVGIGAFATPQMRLETSNPVLVGLGGNRFRIDEGCK